jgi:hypothetical protein
LKIESLIAALKRCATQNRVGDALEAGPSPRLLKRCATQNRVYGAAESHALSNRTY